MPAPQRMKRKEQLRKLVSSKEVDADKLTLCSGFPSGKEQESETSFNKESLDGSATSEKKKSPNSSEKRMLVGSKEVDTGKLTLSSDFPSGMEQESETSYQTASFDGSATLEQKKSHTSSQTQGQRNFCMINAQQIADLLGR